MVTHREPLVYTITGTISCQLTKLRRVDSVTVWLIVRGGISDMSLYRGG